MAFETGDQPLAADYSVPQRLLADAQLAVAPLTNPQQVWDGAVTRAQHIASDPGAAAKELVEAAPVAIGTGVCFALAARQPGRIGTAANWLLKSKTGFAVMTAGTPYLFAAPQFIDTFANPQNLAANEQAFAQSFGTSLTDGAVFTGIAVGSGKLASAGMNRLAQRRGFDASTSAEREILVREETANSRSAEGQSTGKPKDSKPEATQDSARDSINEVNRHRYTDLVEERRRAAKATDSAQFDQFEALAKDGTGQVDLEKLTTLLDENYGGYFDHWVKSWAREHKGTTVAKFIDEYYADPDKQLSRVKTAVGKVMDDTASQTTDTGAADEMRSAMSRFEARAKSSLSQKEVQDSLHMINMLYKQGHTELAVQALLQAADPRIITQSSHPTCTLTAMEVWMYSKQPSIAIDALYNLATQGKSGAQFRTAAGEVVHLDAFMVKPEAGALNIFDPRSRSYASQLFQMLAANMVHQPRGITYEFEKKPLPDGGYIRNDAVFQTVAGNHVPGQAPLGFMPEEAQHAAEGMGAIAPMTIIHPTEFADFTAFEEAMLALQKEDFPALIAVDALPLVNPLTFPMDVNHTIPIFSVDSFGKNMVAFRDNWRFDVNPANRARRLSLRNMWAIGNPRSAAGDWNPLPW